MEPPLPPNDHPPRTPHDDDASLLPTTASPTSDVPTKAIEEAAPHPIKYRADIDGLRALAVVPVILFHAYPERFPSGFIGVDVFFVISGYLISSILFKECTKGTFTYGSFYSRRIRRIYPTLLLMLSLTFWLGCLYLLSAKLQALATTMLAGTMFSANLQVMLLDRGYFDDDIKENPLLHLWSLGVEEQFYIFWPCFASILTRLSVRSAVVMQVAVLALSFTCNIFFLGFHGTNKYSFYFPLSRFWQMGMGGLLAYVNHIRLTQTQYASVPTSSKPLCKATSDHQATGLSWVGLGCIVLSFACLDESSAFPGYWAVLPTLGTALLIFAGPTAWFNQSVLSLPSMVFVGKLSYALYLWHWPLLVFAKLRFPNPDFRPNYMTPMAMLGLAFVLSLSSLYHVENSLRRHKGRWVVPALMGCMLGMSILAGIILASPDSFSYSQQAMNARAALPETVLTPSVTVGLVPDIPNVSRENATKEPTHASIIAAELDILPDIGLPIPKQHVVEYSAEGRLINPGQEDRALVIALGDAHLDMVKPRFQQLALHTNPIEFPTIAFKSYAHTPLPKCIWWPDYDMIKKVRPNVVFMSINWLAYLHPGGAAWQPAHEEPPCCPQGYGDSCKGQNPKDVEAILTRFQSDLTDMVSLGAKVFVTTVAPEGNEFDPKVILDSAVRSVNRSVFRTNHKWLIDLVEGAITGANATVIDFSENLCWEDTCRVVDPSGVPVRRNSNVFTPKFAAKYLSVLDQVVAATMATPDDVIAPPDAPNSNRFSRIANPSYDKIMAAPRDFNVDVGFSPAPADAPFGTTSHATMMMNPGQPNLIFAYGDSHANQVKPRFLRSFEDRHGARNRSNFPTVVFKSLDATPALTCQEHYDIVMAVVERVRPKVFLHSMNWPQFLRPGGLDSDRSVAGTPKCCLAGYQDKCTYQRPKDVVTIMNKFQQDMTKLTGLGIKVFVATINVEGEQFNPYHMLSGNDVGDVSPVSKAAFRLKHKWLLGLIENATAAANATLIDYSDNYCWNDSCGVVDDLGRPVMKDTNHLTRTYTHKYLGVIDQIVDAAMKI
ncbi:hypothetical protein DYB26_007369 [Aphanomyces astaci]|uniref:Acyltransferase 3 domain-containing protein n=2 Tax=Aphanomyces astaci TaxID=112090 RepID=A0A3R6WUP5_APHAT|nr:hypothetical protein DYB26_007369 [Aphanomyces astaci]